MKRKHWKTWLEQYREVKLKRLCEVKQRECDQQIKTIQFTTQQEIDSLKYKLEESHTIIDRDRREKMAIQEGLKKA